MNQINSKQQRAKVWIQNCETLAMCSINCEVLPYLHHLAKLTFGLFNVASATKQRLVSSQFSQFEIAIKRCEG